MKPESLNRTWQLFHRPTAGFEPGMVVIDEKQQSGISNALEHTAIGDVPGYRQSARGSTNDIMQPLTGLGINDLFLINNLQGKLGPSIHGNCGSGIGPTIIPDVKGCTV